MKILPEGKIKLYLMEADKRGLLTAFYLELTTGLRRGEVPAFLWADLDMENRTISITKQVNRIKGELAASQPKTQNSVRILPISQQAAGRRNTRSTPENPYMFPSFKMGGMFDTDSCRHTHEKILKTIGAEHIRFHDLRHFQARCVYFISSGQTINIVEVINAGCYNFLRICLLIFCGKLRRHDYGFL